MGVGSTRHDPAVGLDPVAGQLHSCGFHARYVVATPGQNRRPAMLCLVRARTHLSTVSDASTCAPPVREVGANKDPAATERRRRPTAAAPGATVPCPAPRPTPRTRGHRRAAAPAP